jgi:hypothetical protein
MEWLDGWRLWMDTSPQEDIHKLPEVENEAISTQM